MALNRVITCKVTLAQRAGIQPVTSLKEASARFWQRTGKP
jgi:hypothetical protein